MFPTPMMVRLSAATLGKHRQCFRELPLFFFFFIPLLLSTAVGGNSIFAHVTDKGPFYCGTALSFFFLLFNFSLIANNI